MSGKVRSKVVSIHDRSGKESGEAHAGKAAGSEVTAEPVKRRGRPRLGKAVARDLSRDEEILRIAAEVVWKKGFSGTKLGDIAEAAGIVKGSLYHYFDSKEEIYERLVKNVRGMLDFDAEVKGSSPAAERLEHLVRTRLDTTVQYPLEVALLVRELIHMKGPAGDWAREDPKKYFNAIRQIIIQGQKEGTFRPVDPDVIASVIHGIFAHLPNWYRRGGRIDPEALTDEVTEFILTGLLQNPPRRVKR
ncbi:TetR/AcrR family transcriptional regulator [Sinimarinibacterium flocculans]|uniref:TetR/AcrR family transcriptional regulator n=1 Tax=Sinimarinibacterium flocculans TaxID=985250 RepID=UPI0024915B79|nr:TetR/AcrR family transcriptional regulator [Sinimarinibacterium flocculans]